MSGGLTGFVWSLAVEIAETAMTSLDRFKVRLLRSNHARLEEPAIKRWLREVCSSVLNTEGNGTKFPEWLKRNELTSLAAIFIRDDGWSLGAKRTQVPAAERMWRQNWKYIALKPKYEAILYSEWNGRQQQPLDWTSRANFAPEKLEKNETCGACKNPLSRGRAVLTATYFGKAGAKRKLAVCDDRCWATWNDRYWQAKADARKQIIERPCSEDSAKARRLAKLGYPVKGGALP